MKTLKVLLLVHQSLIPPDEDFSPKAIENKAWKTEYDVLSALKSLGHDSYVVGVGNDIAVIQSAIHEYKPHIVFNLLEEFAGEAVYDQNIVSFLELMGVKYTGSDARGLLLGRDKGLAKQLMRYHNIPTPDFFVFKAKNKLSYPTTDAYPLFVKPLNEEASMGITQDSIVKNQIELEAQLDHYFNKYELDVIAEKYIEGREFYVGILGNERLKVLPIWELFFGNLAEGVPKIATNKVKWDLAYRKKYGIRTGTAGRLKEDQKQMIQDVAADTYRALYLSGYARMDMRMDVTGNIFVLEANPNPDCGYREDLADSAARDGMCFEDLIAKIISLGLNRKK